MGKTIEKSPKAKSMLVGLRAVGYSFQTAVADIIDNSIAAHANKIFVEGDVIEGDPSSAYIFVLDDGFGIEEDRLSDAMSFGSDSVHDNSDERDLGRFGLGLNTASLSQCRKFTVISKIHDKICGAFWDCDILEETNRWVLNILDEQEFNKYPGFRQLKEMETGTLVIWQKFDRIECTSRNFEESFRERIQQAKEHCTLVFHRFYDEIEIYFNMDRVEKRDPFLSDFDATQKCREQCIEYQGSEIPYQAYVLPHQTSMTDEQKRLIGGLDTIKRQQGFYLYRNKRLIVCGSWFRMNHRSKMHELARIRVDIPSSLDSFWMLDVKKTTATIPDALKQKLYAAIDDSSLRSKRAIVFQGEKEYSGSKQKVWNRIKTRDNKIIYKINTDMPLIEELKETLGEKSDILFKALGMIEDYLPKQQLNIDIEESNLLTITDEEANKKAEEAMISMLKSFGVDRASDMFDAMVVFEDFSVLKDKKDEILKKVSCIDGK